ncbi:phosphoadenosine phosphosulfate reductase domain-containing protein [Actinacidiphila acididurans]|uniref:Phosphoadenosine phosphosulfate reductase family protein n=1 Tax=Actinacidiphila acididurans TaxID=2784346 RepID=A0ABS2U346_9ACTN|nr:phosphoadenosine phosphosulfate reductase family protein [Actinacidiphila acididurans]MBM9510019.1 phosphoadenosine phosphosulfate reductase family protein [Actinacidiphila acididurans]
MTGRNARRPQADMLDGMPDVTAAQPPKASEEAWKARTLDEAIDWTYDLLDRAIVQFSTGNATTTITKGKRAGQVIDYGPRELAGIFGLYSGGNDSVVTIHILRKYMQERALFRPHFGGIVHVNTGTAVEETTQHVREAVPAWGMPLHELTPRVTYLDLVLGNVRSTRGPNIGRSVWVGFPGPASATQSADGRKQSTPHNVMYMRLKDQPLQEFRRQRVGRDGVRRKVMYIGGMRWDESDKRFRTAEEIDVDGGIVWVSPLVHWTNAHMREYRSRYRCTKNHKHQPHRMCGDEALPWNEVTEHLHMSGDCACGAYAKPNEKDERSFFYPSNGKMIDHWEGAVRAAGIAANRWGQAPPKDFVQTPAGNPAKPVMERLCVGCAPMEGQLDVTDGWLSNGLITAAQHAILTGTADQDGDAA